LIRINELCKSFGVVKAVDRLSFEVNQGEIFGLLGPNGAGKTTTIKMILGMLKADSGEVYFEGGPIGPDDQSYKNHIGYVPESGALYETLTGREYLEFVGNLYHMPDNVVRHKVKQLLEILDLDQAADQAIREYSKGMKQKLLISSALIHEPRLVILDEPFSGLDANTVSVFKELFREYVNGGRAIIFCSHILEVVERLVSRVMIIREGQCLVDGTPDEIIKQTGQTSLDRAFNTLTGAGDINDRARRFIRALSDTEQGENVS